MVARVVLVAGVLAVVTCGGGKPPVTTAPATSGSGAVGGAGGGSDAPAARPGVEQLSSASGDGLAAAGTAAAYLHALAEKDWPGACHALARAERARMAKAGSCERGVEQQAAARAGAHLETASTAGVRKRDGVIAVDFVQPAQTNVVETLFLRREDGLWLVVHLPADQAF